MPIFKLSWFVKRVSDRRRDISDLLPTGGKLVEAEIRAYELANGSETSPRFYGFEEDSVEIDGKHVKYTSLFLEKGGESLEDFFSQLDLKSPLLKNQINVKIIL